MLIKDDQPLFFPPKLPRKVKKENQHKPQKEKGRPQHLQRVRKANKIQLKMVVMVVKKQLPPHQ